MGLTGSPTCWKTWVTIALLIWMACIGSGAGNGVPECAERVLFKGHKHHWTWKAIAEKGDDVLHLEHSSFESPSPHVLISLKVSVDNSGQHCGPFPAAGVTMHTRPQTTDMQVFSAIWLEHEFKFLDELLGSQNTGPVRRIIDMGGNCGMSSLYFATHWPNATIVTIEPSISNFAILTLNLGLKNNVFLERSAVSDRVGFASIVDRNWGHWAYGTKHLATDSQHITTHVLPTVSVDHLLRKYNWDQVDYMKIDIEGGEMDLCHDLLSGATWGSKVGCVSFEFHDRWGGALANVNKVCHEALIQAGLKYKASVGQLTVFCRS